MNRIYTATVSFFILIISFTCKAQRADVWVFGANFTIDFKEKNPSPEYFSGYNASFGAEGESTATYCDENGDLKYYFLSPKIYDGDKKELKGTAGIKYNQTNTKGVLFVPYPNHPDSILFFSTDRYGLYGPQNLYLSTINNDSVYRLNTLIDSAVIEGVTAIQHSNGDDYWLLTHSVDSASNEFKAFLIDSSGVSTTPISSNIGLINSCFQGACGDVQAIEVNSCGNKIAYQYLDVIQLFDFNPTTGIISNLQKTIIGETDYYSGGSARDDLFYGLEFSPNGNYLYCTRPYNKVLLRFNLNNSNDSLFSSQADTLISANTLSSSIRFGDVDIAPNGKMFMAHHTWGSPGILLTTINNPNAALNDLEIDFANFSSTETGSSGQMGLPNYIKSFTYNTTNLITDCSNGNTSLRLTAAFSLNNSYNWSINHGNSFTDGKEIQVSLPIGKHHVSYSYQNYCGNNIANTDSFEVSAAPLKLTENIDCNAQTGFIAVEGIDTNGIIWYTDNKGEDFLTKGTQPRFNGFIPDSIWGFSYNSNTDSLSNDGAFGWYSAQKNHSILSVYDDLIFTEYELGFFSYVQNTSSLMRSYIIDEQSDTLFIDTFNVAINLKTDTIIKLAPHVRLNRGTYKIYNELLTGFVKISIYNSVLGTDTTVLAGHSRFGPTGQIVLHSLPTSSCTVDTVFDISSCATTGINSINYRILIYPNPAKNQLTIQSRDLQNSIVSLYDLNGKKVTEHFKNQNEEAITIATNNFPNGIYLLQLITSDGMIYSEKVIIE